MKLFEAEAITRWSAEGSTTGRLLVGFPTRLERNTYYGGRMIELLERYAESDPDEKAICLVIDEASEGRVDDIRPLLPLIGGFVTFGEAFGFRSSHYKTFLQGMTNVNPEFVGGIMHNQLSNRIMTTIEVQDKSRDYAGEIVRLELDSGMFSIHTVN